MAAHPTPNGTFDDVTLLGNSDTSSERSYDMLSEHSSADKQIATANGDYDLDSFVPAPAAPPSTPEDTEETEETEEYEDINVDADAARFRSKVMDKLQELLKLMDGNLPVSESALSKQLWTSVLALPIKAEFQLLNSLLFHSNFQNFLR